MNSKRSQIEILGMVVIVIIISIAMFFVLFFVLKQKGSLETTTFSKETYINNLLATMLEVKTPCRGRTLSSIVKTCAWTNHFDRACNDFPEKTPCEYANDEIAIILNRTLDYVGMDYRLFVVKEATGEQVLSIQHGACAGNFLAGTFILPSEIGDISFNLDICER